jgi:hypothetical protein
VGQGLVESQPLADGATLEVGARSIEVLRPRRPDQSPTKYRIKGVASDFTEALAQTAQMSRSRFHKKPIAVAGLGRRSGGCL